MKSMLDSNLDSLAIRMGGFLRGFNDPSVHLGSSARFAVEFRKILELPELHSTGIERAFSYSEAARRYRFAHLEATGNDPSDPVSTMIRGLSCAPQPAAGIQGEHPLWRLREDLQRILRVPALLFYLQVADRAAFYIKLNEVARKGSFPLAAGWKGSGMSCPSCTGAIMPDKDQGAFRCIQCGLYCESIRPLPMVPGVVATVSYDMLREVVALDLVETYQEEGEIRPLVSGSLEPR